MGRQGCTPTARPASSARSGKVTERFETAPGHQAQLDWSPYTVELGGELLRAVVYGMTLGASSRGPAMYGGRCRTATAHPLPDRRLVGSLALARKVSWDCLVCFQGSRYSVPGAYAGGAPSA